MTVMMTMIVTVTVVGVGMTAIITSAYKCGSISKHGEDGEEEQGKSDAGHGFEVVAGIRKKALSKSPTRGQI
jgi:hypothetical protein